MHELRYEDATGRKLLRLRRLRQHERLQLERAQGPVITSRALGIDRASQRAARAILSAPFTMPAVNATGIAEVEGTRGVRVGDRVWVEPIGYHEITFIQED